MVGQEMRDVETRRFFTFRRPYAVCVANWAGEKCEVRDESAEGRGWGQGRGMIWERWFGLGRGRERHSGMAEIAAGGMVCYASSK